VKEVECSTIEIVVNNFPPILFMCTGILLIIAAIINKTNIYILTLPYQIIAGLMGSVFMFFGYINYPTIAYHGSIDITKAIIYEAKAVRMGEKVAELKDEATQVANQVAKNQGGTAKITQNIAKNIRVKAEQLQAQANDIKEQSEAIVNKWLEQGKSLLYGETDRVPKSDEEALEWYKNEAQNGNAKAQLYLGVMSEKGKDYEEAIEWYGKAAEQELAEAQLRLGIMYRTGKGVPRNDAEGARWYRKAAEPGLAEAQFYLA
jgi:TPR repeat protein